MSGPMDFMFALATRARVVFAAFALRNKPVWRDECDTRNCAGGLLSRERRITTAGNRRTQKTPAHRSQDRRWQVKEKMLAQQFLLN
jgi:predicted lipase